MKKTKIQKLIYGILVCIIVAAFCVVKIKGNSQEEQQDYAYSIENPGEVSVVYLPLDNRPINDYQVRLFAESIGVNLIMPENSDSYASTLNGAVTSFGLQYGDIEGNFEWLKSVTAEPCIIIVSLDQLLSGGLLNSRAETELSKEYEMLDYLASLGEGYKLYVIDSQMRLASSSEYLDWTSEDYALTREYGKAERLLPENTDDLSLDWIFANYDTAPDGGSIASDLGYDKDANSTLEKYFAVRMRKLKLNAYAIEKLACKENVTYLFCVDDSAAGNNIQTAEYMYLNNLAQGKLTDLSSTDCMGQMALSIMFKEVCNSEDIKVKVSYFGQNPRAELDFAGLTLQQAVEQSIEICGGIITDQEDYALEILVATGGSETELSLANSEIIERLNSNIESEIPCIYIDFADSVNKDLPVNSQISMLLAAGLHGNGSGASAIMGISQGFARYRALSISGYSDKNKDAAFAELLTYTFAKGYYWNSNYWWEMNEFIRSDLGLDPNNFSVADESLINRANIILTLKVTTNSKNILESLSGGKYISSLAPYKTGAIKKAEISNCTFPWLRSFEFIADTNVVLK